MHPRFIPSYYLFSSIGSADKAYFNLKGGYLDKSESSLPKLTECECAVLHLLIQGKTNKEMAQALNICVKAVEKRIYSVYKKFGVGDRPQAVAHALQVGFEVKR